MFTDELATIKSMLSIDDNLNDKVLNNILVLIAQRMSNLIGQSVPPELKYILVEASISRFNRVNDEGKTSSSESDVHNTYEVDDLAPFKSDIDAWLQENGKTPKGSFHFL